MEPTRRYRPLSRHAAAAAWVAAAACIVIRPWRCARVASLGQFGAVAADGPGVRLTTSMVAHAAVRGIRIHALSELEGDIDLHGFLGLAADVPKGYTAIRANFRVDAAEEDLPRIRELAEFSPVFNTLMEGTRADVQVQPA